MLVLSFFLYCVYIGSNDISEGKILISILSVLALPVVVLASAGRREASATCSHVRPSCLGRLEVSGCPGYCCVCGSVLGGCWVIGYFRAWRIIHS